MASADDLVKPMVFAADATLAGGARAEVCVRLLNAESSSSQPEAVGPLALPVKTLLSRYQRVVHWTLAP